MFNIFKKKDTASPGISPRIVQLLELFENLSTNITELYGTFESCNPNPVELRFFTMSALSLCAQAYGEMPEDEMQATVNKFTEQAVATLILKMPRADYTLLHNAFVDRFADYCGPIVNVLNAGTTTEVQDATFELMTTMDAHMRVERDAFLTITTGLGLLPILREFSVNVRDVFVA